MISFVAVILAFVTAALLLTAADKNALQSFAGMASTAVGSNFAVGTTLTKAVPRLLPALGVALALRSGLWNIGAEGQIYLGAAAAAGEVGRIVERAGAGTGVAQNRADLADRFLRDPDRQFVAIEQLRRNIPRALALPLAALEPFRIANQYGLFAVMTRNRYEIEFQGSDDQVNWTPYQFRNKPQALNEAPRIYAPYQPRFDWNLWFASLGDWRENEMVPLTEERLLLGDEDVLALFRGNPFPQIPPRYVRAVLWQYWFTSMDEKRRTGDWWRREDLGLYAPELTMTEDGKFAVVEWPQELPPHD